MKFLFFSKGSRFLNNNYPYYLPVKYPKVLRSIWYKRFFYGEFLYLIAFIVTILTKKIGLFKGKWDKYDLFQKLNNAPRKRLFILLAKEQIHPQYYHYFNLQEENQWKKRHRYLYHASLVHCLRQFSKLSEAKILNDKLLFNQFCKQHSIVTAKNYGYTNDLAIIWLTEKPWQQQQDFIIKPSCGSAGRGFVKFLFHPQKKTYSSSVQQKDISLTNIEAHLSSFLQQHREVYLIQEKLSNHPIIGNLCNDALACVRILSIRDKNGEIKLIRPIIKMPQGDAVLNYLHTGALATPVDLKTGTLGKLIGWKFALYSNHPYFNIPVEGCVLPYWELLKGQAVFLHKQLPAIPLIGWDIAITSENPVFLEGNIQPSLDIHQKQPFEPFIPSEFFDLLLYHFQHGK